jgi:hypothetical protein
MNQQLIFDLAIKSGHIVGQLPLNVNEKNQLAGLAKFAELIVKECAEVAGCNGHVSGFALGDLIKQHFGVEE